MKRVIIVLIALVILIHLVSAEVEKDYLCQKVYDTMQLNGSSDFMIKEIILEKKIEVDKTLADYYFENWENICSEEVLLTLNPQPICENIYYFIIGNNYNYSELDLFRTSKEINVSEGMFENYLNHYYSYCYDKGFSEELPEREFPELKLEEHSDNCYLKKDGVYQILFPKFEIYIGKKNCTDLNLANNFFEYEEFDGEFRINGVRIYWVIALLVFLLFLFLFLIFKRSKKK